jgi:large exoprotein involved in heme utilization and adhesion
MSRTLGVTGGNAHLFLINPNGIIFGSNARLDLGGSFVATTANALEFPDGSIFSASAGNIPSPTLTVNPSAFLFNQLANQQTSSIEVRNGAVLSVGSIGNPESLLLVGGNVQQYFAGGGNTFPNRWNSTEYQYFWSRGRWNCLFAG